MLQTLFHPLRHLGRVLVGLPAVYPPAGVARALQSWFPFRKRRQPQLFMDVIHLPHSTEDLGRRQIRHVNRLRRPLIDDDSSVEHATNHRVKQAMADGLGAAGVTSVLDWGCGYHSLKPFLGRGVTFVGVDIDPAVIKENIRTGVPCLSADEAAQKLADDDVQAIVSIFVFHFRLPQPHIDAMAALVAEHGFILANVYRRTPQSREALAAAFRDKGLLVLTEKDPTEAATGNEFWFIAAPVTAQNLGDKVLHAVSEAMLASHRP